MYMVLTNNMMAFALQRDNDILWLVKEDKLGKALQDLSLKTRERASKLD